jgi:hypothetical protein
MIVSTSAVIDLAAGTEKSVPQGDDSSPTIPSIIQPTVNPVVGHQFRPLGFQATTGTSVATNMSNLTIGVSAGVTTTILTLPPGLYKLDIQLMGRFILTPTAGTGVPDIFLDLGDALAVNRWIVIGLLAITGQVLSVNRTLELLTKEVFLLRFRQLATVAGQTIEAFASVNVVRRL